MRPQLLIRKIHRWAGLILGIQIMLWFFSGFMMSLMPIDEVRGDHLLKVTDTPSLDLSQLDLTALAQRINQPVTAIKIKSWLGRSVAEVQTADQIHMFALPELTALTPINQSQLERILAEQLKPEYRIESVHLLDHVPNEARGRKAPLYQVQISGDESPVIYVSQQSGEIVAKRTDRWRLFDFLWMLHIMDYDEREDFNHPLLYLTALAALLFSLSGVVLIFYTMRPRRKL